MAKIKLVVSATIEETFSDFIISRKTKGLAEKTLQSYQSQFQAVAKHMDVKMDIAMLQKADLDAMIISMRDASLSPNSINSYRDFDIAWSLILRPGQRFLKTEKEKSIFLSGYAKHGQYNISNIHYYMAQIYVYFLSFCGDDAEYCNYIRAWLLENCNCQ